MERQENQAVFPSLSDAALRQLGLWLQANSGDEREPQLTDGDVENKYTSLVLAFKTDKLTLTRRLELQNKLRDQAEINMTHEFDALKSVIQLLSTVCIDAEKAEMFEKIRQQVETLYKATLRVSSTAEMYGAVQQENRLSKAVDIVLRHVDNLKQAYDKEKTEHEETKKLAQKETKPVSPAVSALKNSGKRRASIATLHQGQSHGEAVNASAEEKMLRRGSSSRRGSRSQLRRANTHKEELKTESHLEKGTEETLGNIHEKVERRCSHIVYSDDQGLSGTSQANSCTEGETDTDDDSYYEKQHVKLQNIEQIHKRLPNRYKFRKRSSFCAPPWVLKIMAYLQWLQPYEDFALQARYFLAGIFVLTAIGIVLSNFFVSQEA
uniref:Protein MRVI1 n=3 Tax=Lygus hesperus TaxID=30085 RepID=A0A0K8SKW9_LYGHE